MSEIEIMEATESSEATATPAAAMPAPDPLSLEEVARQMAAGHHVVEAPGRKPWLTERLHAQSLLIAQAHREFAAEVQGQENLPHAAEWLLDNHYLVRRAARQIEEDLPAGYYRELPKLASGPLEGYPRTYAIALGMIRYGNGRLETGQIERFVNAYQEQSALTMGEIWSIPIMLRLGLVTLLAQALAPLIVQTQRVEVKAIELEAAIVDASADEIVSYVIPGLRLLDVLNWDKFFEHVSLVERVLRDDPAGIYAAMTFKTRDRYRVAIEQMARWAKRDEVATARHTVQLAEGAASEDVQRSPRLGHVGYYLIGEGRTRLERDMHCRVPWQVHAKRWLRRHALPIYLGGIGLMTLFQLAILGTYLAGLPGFSPGLFLLTLLVVFLSAVQISVNLVQWLATRLLPPTVLPKMDFRDAIPDVYRTMVAVPAMLSHEDEIQNLLHQLEQHYLGNPDSNLCFALLTDFGDAPEEHLADDEKLLHEAEAGIAALNRRYARQPYNPFYLFHRARRWNPGEGVWMGWERKRGKLIEFNRLLLDQDETTFISQVGDLSVLQTIKYIITLDADTSLPGGSARRLVGAMAHPLNCPQFSPNTGLVTAGYGIMQPRVSIRPSSTTQSLFARIYAGDTGLDLYTRAVSDVYQDLFGTGVFVGKGIYDVAALEQSLSGRVPENALLSHDLFEGLHTRAALISDVVVYEDYPASYLIHMRRLHRWIRGDWQLLPWLMPRIPTQSGEKIPNPFPAIDRWKMLDNLRRSLYGPALLALLALGWLWLPGSPLVWTGYTLLVLFTPLLVSLFNELTHRSLNELLDVPAPHLATEVVRRLLVLVFLPYSTVVALDAIASTLVRMYVTHRHLLQWVTMDHTVRLFGKQQHFTVIWWRMAGAVLLALALGLLVFYVNPAALPIAAPFVLIWMASPAIAHWISQPRARRRRRLTSAEVERLRRLARRTWFFYETFVGPDDNWLPPDNYQEAPVGRLAHRTSPTNLGLTIVSYFAAFDFGYMGPLGLAQRLLDVSETMNRLDRHRGHLLNWYDTRNLQPLSPRYVSTVDSGNLAASLIVVQYGCQEVLRQPVMRWSRWQGLLDTVGILEETLVRARPHPPGDVDRLIQQLRTWRQEIHAVHNTPDQWLPLLFRLHDASQPALMKGIAAVAELDEHRPEMATLRSLRIWAEQVTSQLFRMRREAERLLPVPFPPDTPRLFAGSPSLEEDPDDHWQKIRALIQDIPTLEEVPNLCRKLQAALAGLKQSLQTYIGDGTQAAEAISWCDTFAERLVRVEDETGRLVETYRELAQHAAAEVEGMDFNFLFDQQRQLFHIGYNVEAMRLDDNYYDLLASEARIASLLAIAKRDVPQRHWVHMSRPQTEIEGRRCLLSWSGTMFEYLMPVLFSPIYEGTLLGESAMAAVQRQIAYGRSHDLPWGVSESGYYHFDAHQNYQYRAFGVPGLGLKRGLEEDQVIAPYASLLALSVAPDAVVENLADLDELGALGEYGYYEAVDFTPSRMPGSQSHAIVRSFMVHHQGMALLALGNFLHDDAVVRRFHADPRIRNVELLLQEMIPARVPVEQPTVESEQSAKGPRARATATPWPVLVHTPAPLVHVLSNGSLSTLLTNRGGGYSAWGEIALTRWRADTTLDGHGVWLYVQDRDRGDLWSVANQPTATAVDTASARFYPHKAEYQCRHLDTTVKMEVAIAPHHDVEIRRLTIVNHSGRRRRLALVSYGEVVLARLEADCSHPAFQKLFVEAEEEIELGGLVFRRRPRASDEAPIWMAHAVAGGPTRSRTTTRMTNDRATFLGRGRSARRPQALERFGRPLVCTQGAPLDPVFAVSREFTLLPYASTEITFVTTAAGSRREVVDLAQRFSDPIQVERAFEQARTAIEAQMRRLNLTSSFLEQIQSLLSPLLYPQRALRAAPAILAANRLGQPGLWPYAISGDYPILLVRINRQEELSLVREVLLAHRYWRARQIRVDLVLLNQEEVGYNQEVQGELLRLMASSDDESWVNRRGGIFVVNGGQLQPAEVTLLETAARAIVDAGAGSLEQQMEHISGASMPLPPFVPVLSAEHAVEQTPPLDRPHGLRFDNGIGGFSADGREYVIYLRPGATTPAPWINVIANPEFGFMISAAGASNSWVINSGENRLTTWGNDPVSEPTGEALYLRDEETGRIWSSTPLPCPATNAPYLVRHGAGYTTFVHHSNGLKQELRLFAAMDARIKVVHLRLENVWSRPRRLTATYYAEWVLGAQREATQPYICQEYDAPRHALLARNFYNTDFAAQVAFVAASQPLHGLTADRTEFLGAAGSLANPAALERMGLSGTVEAGLDPCAALQIHVDLQPGEVREVSFLVGQAPDQVEAVALIERFLEPAEVEAAWHAVHRFWDDLLGTVTVKTPDPAADFMLNRWLLYQTVACRMWGRSGFYQSSGAYGFRDQLQDCMALVHVAPDLSRKQILNAARHQFEAGDVLHWWHPPAGRGVRTRISDDLLWLPFVTCHYVRVTGDDSILCELVPFLRAEPLAADEEERYAGYLETEEQYTLYEHCRRAIQRGATSGIHGLPLMGSGDWNDGMNRVGIHGYGESVWLGWFLYTVLQEFVPLCERMDDEPQAADYRNRAERLREALEASGWDGAWYRRAFYDDGAPLGSAQNRECRIDSIAQSWAVISGAGDSKRTKQAMDSVHTQLARRDGRLLLLFQPPFDKTPHDPGYIKGYPPGIRENGGQYTHAAVWTIWAYTLLGQGDRAGELFDWLNPISHGGGSVEADRYRVEPYVLAGDVSGAPPHVGRGGWTWYTGSAGWMYRLGIERILGLQRCGNSIHLDPCIPSTWSHFSATVRHGSTDYHIEVENPHGVCRGVRQLTVDGEPCPDGHFPLADDGRPHTVHATLG